MREAIHRAWLTCQTHVPPLRRFDFEVGFTAGTNYALSREGIVDLIAAKLKELSYAAIGADRSGDGYAVYFYDGPEREVEVLVVGGFPSVNAAGKGKNAIRAQQIVDALAKGDACSS